MKTNHLPCHCWLKEGPKAGPSLALSSASFPSLLGPHAASACQGAKAELRLSWANLCSQQGTSLHTRVGRVRSAIDQAISYNSISREPGWLLDLGYLPASRDAPKHGGKVIRPLGKRAASTTACPVFVLGLSISASSHVGSTQPPHQTHLCHRCISQQLCPAPRNLSSMGIAGTGRELSCHPSCAHGPLGACAQGRGLAVGLGAAQDKRHPFPHAAVLLRCIGLWCSSSNCFSALSLWHVDPKLCSQLDMSCDPCSP